MRNLIFLFFAFVLIQKAQALEPQNPTAYCDRFLSEPEQKDCEKKVQTLAPDWYLAAVCSQQEADASFFDCLKISSTGNFAPLKLNLCQTEGLSDQDRMSCIRAAKADIKEAYQQPSGPKQRHPAHKKTKNQKTN